MYRNSHSSKYWLISRTQVFTSLQFQSQSLKCCKWTYTSVEIYCQEEAVYILTLDNFKPSLVDFYFLQIHAITYLTYTCKYWNTTSVQACSIGCGKNNACTLQQLAYSVSNRRLLKSSLVPSNRCFNYCPFLQDSHSRSPSAKNPDFNSIPLWP